MNEMKEGFPTRPFLKNAVHSVIPSLPHSLRLRLDQSTGSHAPVCVRYRLPLTGAESIPPSASA